MPPLAARRRRSALLIPAAATAVILTLLGAGAGAGAGPPGRWLGVVGRATSMTPPQAQADTRPNILLVVTDDQREGTVRPGIMPNTHRVLVRGGFRFTNSFVTNPWCCPSRASILTGQYSHTNGVWTVGGRHGMQAWLPHESSTLATWLHQAGYRTGIVGKYLNEYGTDAIPAYQPPGWDTTAIMTNLVYSVNPGYFDYNLFENGTLVPYGSDVVDYSTRVFTRKARRFVAPTGDGKPWFLYLAYTSPHGPPIADPIDTSAALGLTYPMPANVCEEDVSDKPAFVRSQPPCAMTPEQYADRMRTQQARMLTSVDRGLGLVFGDLEATGQLENTLIVFISDNGTLVGNHRFLHGKELPYEESVRVPLMMRWDALGAAPRTIGALALNIDLAPTITDAAGVTEHDAYDGTSLLPLLRGTSTDVRSDFLVEHLTTGPRDEGGPSYCGVRTKDFKYVEYSTGERELYDLVVDPAELANRDGDAGLQTTETGLRSRMLELCSPSPPDWTPQ